MRNLPFFFPLISPSSPCLSFDGSFPGLSFSAVVGVVKLALEAGKATPAPPVGPALGSKGVNIMAFCKEYNAKTAEKAGYVIPVEITVYDVSRLLVLRLLRSSFFEFLISIPGFRALFPSIWALCIVPKRQSVTWARRNELRIVILFSFFSHHVGILPACVLVPRIRRSFLCNPFSCFHLWESNSALSNSVSVGRIRASPSF